MGHEGGAGAWNLLIVAMYGHKRYARTLMRYATLNSSMFWSHS